MIDSIQLFPNFDNNKDMQVNSPEGPLMAPTAHDSQKDVPAFVLGKKQVEENDPRVEEARPQHMMMLQDQGSNVVDPELEEVINSEELQEQIHNLKERLWDARVSIQDLELERLATEHIEAYEKITDLLNDDLYAIAAHTEQQVPMKKETSFARKALDWVSSGEEILNRALLYFSDKNGQEDSLANFLKVQYAVQRATQRAELFASIVGTTVSSVKTIMTTQLG